MKQGLGLFVIMLLLSNIRFVRLIAQPQCVQVAFGTLMGVIWILPIFTALPQLSPFFMPYPSIVWHKQDTKQLNNYYNQVQPVLAQSDLSHCWLLTEPFDYISVFQWTCFECLSCPIDLDRLQYAYNVTQFSLETKGNWQTVQTQIRCRRMQCLIRVFTDCK